MQPKFQNVYGYKTERENRRLTAVGVDRGIGLADPLKMVRHGASFSCEQVPWKMWSKAIFILENRVTCYCCMIQMNDARTKFYI